MKQQTSKGHHQRFAWMVRSYDTFLVNQAHVHSTEVNSLCTDLFTLREALCDAVAITDALVNREAVPADLTRLGEIRKLLKESCHNAATLEKIRLQNMDGKPTRTTPRKRNVR